MTTWTCPDHKSSITWYLSGQSVIDRVPDVWGDYFPKHTLTKQHRSGWTISAKLVNDGSCLTHIREFTARHKTFGKIHGDYGNRVFAESKTALENFMKCHPPEQYDTFDD